jgi:type I restriction enzyme S subunit
LKIHLPSFEEQQSIAAILSSLDDKIELNIRMNKTLEEIAQALFHRWFVEFEFPDEQGKPYKSSGGKMVESEMGMVPEGWRVGTIGDVIDIVGGSTPSTSNPDYWEGGTNAFCTPKDLATNNSVMIFETERHITEAGIESISSKQLPVGTLLLSSRAPIGYLAIVMTPLSINQGFIAMKYNGVISNYYMLHWLLENMEEVHSRANGSTFQEISKKNFRTILFLIPITDILKEFDSLVNILYSQFSLISRENTKFIQIREVLLAKLMGGELRI